MPHQPEQPRVGSLEHLERVDGVSDGLKAYELRPLAEPSDPNWDLSPAHGIVRVWALSPADARIVAAEAETDFLDIDAKPGDGNTTRPASAFRNEKLYAVRQIEAHASPLGRGIFGPSDTPSAKD